MAVEDPKAAPDPLPDVPGNGTFVVLGRYKSLKGLASADCDELSLARAIAEELGATADQVWFTTGRAADIVVVVRNADVRTALAFALAFGWAANVTTETLVAADAAQNVSNEAAKVVDVLTAQGRLMRGGDYSG